MKLGPGLYPRFSYGNVICHTCCNDLCRPLLTQDPINPVETVIVIRSLVPGGIAQMDGRLVPGDRLVFVNDINVENATLDEAVQALKGAPKGTVRIGVAKPLPLPEIGESSTDDIDDMVSWGHNTEGLYFI